MPKDDVKISIRIPYDLDIRIREELLRARKDRRLTSYTSIIIQALDAWLRRGKGEEK